MLTILIIWVCRSHESIESQLATPVQPPRTLDNPVARKCTEAIISNSKLLEDKHDSKLGTTPSLQKSTSKSVIDENKHTIKLKNVFENMNTATPSLESSTVSNSANVPNQMNSLLSLDEPENSEPLNSTNDPVNPPYLVKNFENQDIGKFVLYSSPDPKQNHLGFGQVIRKVDGRNLKLEILAYIPANAAVKWKIYCHRRIFTKVGLLERRSSYINIIFMSLILYRFPLNLTSEPNWLMLQF